MAKTTSRPAPLLCLQAQNDQETSSNDLHLSDCKERWKWRELRYNQIRKKNASHLSENEWDAVLTYLQSRGVDWNHAGPKQIKELFDSAARWENRNLSRWWFDEQTGLQCVAGNLSAFHCFVLDTKRARRALYWLFDLKIHSADYLEALQDANRQQLESPHAADAQPPSFSMEDACPLPPREMCFKNLPLAAAHTVYLRSNDQARLLYAALYLSPYPPVMPGQELWQFLWTDPSPDVGCLRCVCRRKGLPAQLTSLIVSFVPFAAYPARLFGRRWLREVQARAASL